MLLLPLLLSTQPLLAHPTAPIAPRPPVTRAQILALKPFFTARDRLLVDEAGQPEADAASYQCFGDFLRRVAQRRLRADRPVTKAAAQTIISDASSSESCGRRATGWLSSIRLIETAAAAAAR